MEEAERKLKDLDIFQFPIGFSRREQCILDTGYGQYLSIPYRILTGIAEDEAYAVMSFQFPIGFSQMADRVSNA